MRTLLASGLLLFTIAFAVAFGIAAGYAFIHVLLRLFAWRRQALQPQKPHSSPALSAAGD